MDFLSFLPAWLTATPVNFVLVALVIMYLLSLLLESARDDINKKTEVGIICGVESACKRLAATLHRAERFELANSAMVVLEQAMRRDMIILFIVKDELSGIAKSVFAHLQSAYAESENKNRYGGLRYAVFGIGDTLSEDFNALAVEFDLRLRKVGAKSVVPMRLFDVVTSNDGVEQEFSDFVMAFSPMSVAKGPVSTDFPESSDSETTDSDVSDMEQDIDPGYDEQIQELEIVDPVVEIEEPVAEIQKPTPEPEKPVPAVEKPVPESEKPVPEITLPETKSVTTSVETDKPKVELIEPSVDISTSVFETVEPEIKPEDEPEVEAVSPQSELSKTEPEVAVRPKSPKQEKSETEDDEDWEIIKVMSNKDDSS